MSQAHSDKVIFRCECGAKLAIPAESADRRVRCPKCGGSFPGPGAVPAVARSEEAVPPPKSDSSGKFADSRIIVRCHCGVKLRTPATAIGSIIKCPRCDARLAVQKPAPPQPKKPPIRVEEGFTPPVAEQLSSSAIDVLASTSAIAPASAPRPVAREKCPNCDAIRRNQSLICHQCGHDFTKPTLVAPAKTCPSCKTEFPAKTRICVACGIDLKTGRRLLTSDAGNLDQVYATAESAIRWLSWFMWLGIYPIASEGFGTRKPVVVRGVAALTIIVSVILLMAELKGSATADSMRGLMLWSGRTLSDTELSSRVHEEIRRIFGDGVSVPPEIVEEVKERLAEHQAEAGAYRPHQLLTYAFLHGGLMHLAGNMLFLFVLGSRVNALIGNVWTAVTYPILAVAGGLAHMWASRSEMIHPMIGASGAVMGLAGMYLILFPVHRVHMAVWARLGLIAGFRLAFKLFEMRGFWVVLFYISFDVLFTLLRARDGVAHWAHLGGFGVGAVLALLLLVARLVNARGGDLISVLLGQRAWAIVGKPR